MEQSGLLPESQCGFRKDNGTIDMIFTARQLQEKCQEQNMDLYMTFVDLTKAFDTVSREGLWKIMAKFGCPTKFIAMVRQFHDGMLARVQNDGEFSNPFPVTNGVKQGCVLAPTLFSMMFSAMLTDAFQDGDNGMPIRYRFDGKLFNLRRLQAKSKVQTEVLDEFLFADDMAKCAPTEEKMQKGIDQVFDSCDCDLTINIKKTEVVYQPAPGKPYKEPTIT
ncbi:MAG: reverse transcriptase domain-containing protein [Candidatus Thiodiazotropha endolucinida]|nr:reverse transcriptase domain-containing protein [Candidatus Thiodiazotropha endolucinida]